MVMTLSLLVSSIAERRLRASLVEHDETVPNQINQEIQNPTMRWVFQIFEGINLVSFVLGTQCFQQIDGLNDTRNKILKHLGTRVAQFYSKNQIEGCSM